VTLTQPLEHAADVDRVRARTPARLNARIDRDTRRTVGRVAAQTPAEQADALAALDREWDIERVLEAEAALTGLVGLALAIAVHPRFVAVPFTVGGMVLLHALHGWYPLLPLFRAVGLRTRDEIERERYAVKAVRGDFDRVAGAAAARADAAWEAVMR
jgi:hypothetical protein